MPDVELIALHHIDAQALAEEAMAGLLRQPAALSPKFLYDRLGSHLFDAITALDEYYPTRTEAAIFEAHRAEIAAAALAVTGPTPQIIDLGAGNCAKAAGWFEALAPRRYVALDISADFLGTALGQLARAHAQLPMVGIGLDFADGFTLPASITGERSLAFYPGSSIGNFDDEAALRLLRSLRQAAHGGALLIGVDLIKDPAVLEAAYDDSLGVTAAFNLNLLRHVNHLTGSNFSPRDWAHCARWVPAHSRVEMRLVARRALSVQWPGDADSPGSVGPTRHFREGEEIHTESSRKWTVPGFGALLRDAGFRQVRHWTDAKGWFGVFLAH